MLLITDAELLAMGLALNALGQIPSPVRDTARAVASSFVLSHVKKQHTLPLVSWSDDIRRATAHVATYDLLSNRGFNALLAGDPTIRDRYLDACAWLVKLADGRVEAEAIADSTPTVDDDAPLVASDPSRWGAYGNRSRC